jgi:hypothetical protein
MVTSSAEAQLREWQEGKVRLRLRVFKSGEYLQPLDEYSGQIEHIDFPDEITFKTHKAETKFIPLSEATLNIFSGRLDVVCKNGNCFFLFPRAIIRVA